MRGVDDDLDEHRRAERGGSRGGDEPVEPEGRAEGRDPPAEQEDDPDVEQRVEEEIRDVGGRGERRIAAVPEVEEDVADRRGEQRAADEEPGGALGAHENGAREAAECCEQLESLVDPGLVQTRPTRRVMAEVGDREHGDADDEDRLPGPENRRGTKVSRSFHEC